MKLEIAKAGYEGVTQFADALGRDQSYLNALLRRGTCTYFTIDYIACFLGFHPMEFLLDDILADEMDDPALFDDDLSDLKMGATA